MDKTTLSTDDLLVLTLSVQGDVEQLPEPQLPMLQGLTIVSSSRSTQFSIVNGVVSSHSVFTYQLRPTAPGAHTIGAAMITVSGVQYETEPITIEVTAGQAPVQPTPGSTSPAPGDLQDQDLYAKAEVDSDQPFVGQQITYTFRFYQGVNLFDQPHLDWPNFNGFWGEDLASDNPYYQRVNGRQYLVAEVRRALFATTAGQISIEPSELRVPVDFFGREQVLRTQSLLLDVQALPPAAPPDFGGAVGQYEISAWLDPAETRVNEPVTLFVKVSGSGNLSSLPDPTWPEWSGWRVYDPQITTNTSAVGDVIQGERIYERLLVAKSPGDYVIPTFVLSYFDPSASEYQRAETAPLAVHVAPGEESEFIVQPGANGKQEIVVRDKDIRHIKAAPPSLTTNRQSLLTHPLYWLVWLASPLAVVGVWVWERRQMRLRNDVAFARARRAQRRARERLREARALHKQHANDQAIYAVISAALTHYVGDKFNLSAGGLTRVDMRQRLLKAGAADALVERLLGCLEWADSGRFAPSAAGRDTGELLAEAQAIIDELERSIQ